MKSIISSAAIILTSFFYIFTLGSFFGIPFYFLYNRLVTKLQFTDIYIINKYFDHILIVCGTEFWIIVSIKGRVKFGAAAIYGGISLIGILAHIEVLLDAAALMSVPIVICSMIYDHFASRKILHVQKTLYANYFSIMGIVFGIIAGIISSAYPLFSILPASIPVPNYAYAIFVLFSSFSPVLMILIINAIPVKILTTEFVSSILKLKHDMIDSSAFPYQRISSTYKVVYLSLIILLTMTILFIPHLPTINVNNRAIGTDSTEYVEWVNPLIKSDNVWEFIQNAFVKVNGGDRPLTLVFLYSIIKLTIAEPLYIIDFIPLILGPALVLVTYFLSRELTSNDAVSLFASFLTALSFQVLVGLYAGFYANWFALIIGYLSFVFLFRFLKRSKKLNLIIYFFMTTVVLFIHTYTWTMLTMVTGIFLLVMLGFNYYPKRNLVLLLATLSCSIIVDVAKFTMTGSVGGIEQDIHFAATQEVGVGQLPVRWKNLIDTTEIYYGAAFSNVIILTLGLYWVFRSNMRDPSNIFLLVFLSIGIFPLFFGNWLVQSRVFYNIPFQIPSAIALAHIKTKQPRGTLVLIPVCIWLIAMSIRTVSNFYQ